MEQLLRLPLSVAPVLRLTCCWVGPGCGPLCLNINSRRNLVLPWRPRQHVYPNETRSTNLLLCGALKMFPHVTYQRSLSRKQQVANTSTSSPSSVRSLRMEHRVEAKQPAGFSVRHTDCHPGPLMVETNSSKSASLVVAAATRCDFSRNASHARPYKYAGLNAFWRELGRRAKPFHSKPRVSSLLSASLQLVVWKLLGFSLSLDKSERFKSKSQPHTPPPTKGYLISRLPHQPLALQILGLHAPVPRFTTWVRRYSQLSLGQLSGKDRKKTRKTLSHKNRPPPTWGLAITGAWVTRNLLSTPCPFKYEGVRVLSATDLVSLALKP